MKQPVGRTAGLGGAQILSALLVLCLVLTAEAQLPQSALSVKGSAGTFAVWWRSSEAPDTWSSALPSMENALQWRKVRPGLESAFLDMSGDRVGWRIRLILARVDPRSFQLQLDERVLGISPAWSIDSAPADCVMALNAGQFETDRPWGWIVRDSREIQPPRPGPLTSALIVDSAGSVSMIDAAELAAMRSNGRIALAFQSFPSILIGDGRVPEQLRGSRRGVDLNHRDSRLALGLLRDGRILVALTRFIGIGSVLERLPFGPTTPEMAAIMGAIGCRRAVLLDGGLSGQMMLRHPGGKLEKWPGLRSVPLALIFYPRKK